MREKLAWRWIGAHALALGVSSALMGPLEAGWRDLFGEAGLGFTGFGVALGCGLLAYAQTKVPRVRRFPVRFRIWGLTSCVSAVLGFAAALGSIPGWSDLAKRWWPDSLFLSLAGVFVMPLISFAFVNAFAQGLVLFWKTRSGTSWLWTSGVAIGELIGVLLSLLKIFLLSGWVEHPGLWSFLLFSIGTVHGAILALVTLLPLRRVLEAVE